jgi:excisionase family DNA binding protein
VALAPRWVGRVVAPVAGGGCHGLGGLLSTSDVARALGVSQRFVKSLIQAGDLPSLKVGRLSRVWMCDLDVAVERQRGAHHPTRPGGDR